jgi:hypothetical protein
MDLSNHHSSHEGHHSHVHHHGATHGRPVFGLAISATLHCLLGCGIGEVLGMVISAWLGLETFTSTLIAVVLGFVLGMALGVRPLLKRKFTLRAALKTVIIAEGLSILVMESFEVGTQLMIPGVMDAHLSDPVFWIGMFAGLVVGFLAALPVNYVMIRKGVGHVH